MNLSGMGSSSAWPGARLELEFNEGWQAQHGREQERCLNLKGAGAACVVRVHVLRGVELARRPSGGESVFLFLFLFWMFSHGICCSRRRKECFVF